jgi:rhamnosyltransferase
MATASDIAAVVVLFHPPADFVSSLRTYLDQVDHIIAVDNTPQPDPELVSALAELGVVHMSLGENRGIAAALNVGCAKAAEFGCSLVLTMDQDSAATPFMIERLHSCLDDNGAEDVIIAAAALQHVGGLPAEIEPGCTEIDYAITSGCLMRRAAFEQLGGFREEFFIDQVDHELCMRARAEGWRILKRGDALLLHRMGSLRRAGWPLRFYVTDYSAVRRYYMVRNLLALRSEFGTDNPEWLSADRAKWLRDLVKIVLAEPDKAAKFKLMFRGWRDACKGRFGRYEDIYPR